MQCGFLVDRRNAHQTFNAEAINRPALLYETVDGFRHDARLLFFFSRVDLDKQARGAADGFKCVGENAREFWTVERLDAVEQAHSLLCLVGLQGTDKVEIDTVIVRLQLRPFGQGFLHTVLAEDPVTRIQDRTDRLRTEGLADRDKPDGILRPAGLGLGITDPAFDRAQSFMRFVL